MNERNHKDWIEAIVDFRPNLPSSKLFRKWAAISAIAGALGRKCYFSTGLPVYPNLYVMLIGPSRSGKTLSLVTPYDDCFSKLAADADLQKAGKDLGSWRQWVKKPLRMIVGYTTSQKLVDYMDVVSALSADATVEGYSISQPFYDASTTLVTPEFGTLIKKGDEDMQAILTELWDARPEYLHKTRTMGNLVIRGSFLNWIACSTPDNFVETLPANAVEQGLFNRMVIVHTEEQFPNKAFISVGDPDKENIALDHLREDIASIASLRGQFKMSEDCLKMYTDWVEGGEMDRTEPSHVLLTQYNKNRQLQVIKLSMACSASRSNKMIIEVGDFTRAVQTLVEAEKGLISAIKKFGLSKVGASYDKIHQALSHLYQTRYKSGIPGSIARREIIKRSQGIPIEIVLEELIKAGLISWDKSERLIPKETL